jgi:Family of unknown function (DUF6010)
VNAQTILLGALAGGIFVALAEWRGARGSYGTYGIGLVVAAAINVVFAATGPGAEWVGTEIGAGFVFAALAVGGIRRSPALLSVGWLLHMGWDVLLHGGTDTPFVPDWYVPACVGFDLVVAGAILATALPFRRRATD